MSTTRDSKEQALDEEIKQALSKNTYTNVPSASQTYSLLPKCVDSLFRQSEFGKPMKKGKKYPNVFFTDLASVQRLLTYGCRTGKQFSTTEKKKFKTYVDESGLYQLCDATKNYIKDGSHLYIVSPKGGLYIFPFSEGREYFHNSIRASQPVQCAGQLIIENKKIIKINNGSGHYKPTTEQLLRTVGGLFAAGFVDLDVVLRAYAFTQYGGIDYLGSIRELIKEGRLKIPTSVIARGDEHTQPTFSGYTVSASIVLGAILGASTGVGLIIGALAGGIFIKTTEVISTSCQTKKMYCTNEKLPTLEKTWLKSLRSDFPSPEFKTDNSRREHYIYANDSSYVDNYIDQYIQACSTHKETSEYKNTTQFSLLSYLNNKKQYHSLGIIVGNGCILSLLPETPAEDFLLIDIDPMVHFFIMSIKKLILDTDPVVSFSETKKKLISEIALLVDSLDMVDFLELEMKDLGKYHFLYNQDRFNQCKKALQDKELIPMTINIFDLKKIKKLCEFIKENDLNVSFVNYTNLGDYDEQNILLKVTELLPFAEKFTVISTVLRKEHGHSAKCFVSNNINSINDALKSSQASIKLYF